MARDFTAVGNPSAYALATQVQNRPRVGLSHRIKITIGVTTYRFADSDYSALDRNIVVNWGPVPPMVSLDPSAPEEQTAEVTLSNISHDLGGNVARAADTLNDTTLEGSTVVIEAFTRHAFDGVAPELAVFTGIFKKLLSVSQDSVTFRVAGRMAALAKSLDHLVRDDYPQAPPSSNGKIQPLVYGTVPRLPLTPVDCGLVGVLSAGITDADTELSLNEDITAWPTTSRVQIGAREFATYTGKTAATNTLTGLSRGELGSSAMAHEAGEVVIQRPGQWKFLVADRDPDPVQGIDAIWLPDGRKVSNNLWTFDDTTNTVTIDPTPGSGTIEVMGRHHACLRGLSHPTRPKAFAAHGGTGAGSYEASEINLFEKVTGTHSVANITNASHAQLFPWDSTDSAKVWKHWSVPGNLAPSGHAPVGPDTSYVTITDATWKAWDADIFGGDSEYIPPDSVLKKSAVTVTAELAPIIEFVEPDDGTSVYWRNRTDLYPRSFRCRVTRADLTTVERELPVPPFSQFFSPEAVRFFASTTEAAQRVGPHPAQVFVFDFGDELNPNDAPFKVELKAEKGIGSTSGLMARVQALTQGVTGSLTAPWTNEVEVGTKTLTGRGSGNDDMTESATFDFDEEFDYGVLAIKCYAACDYIKVDAGDDRIARFMAPVSMGGRTNSWQSSGSGQLGVRGITGSMVLAGTPTLVTVTAHAFGKDDMPGVPGSGQLTTHDPLMSVDCVSMHEIAVAGDESTPLLPARVGDSAFELAFGGYPTADVNGYVGTTVSGVGSTLLTNPADVAHHYLTDVLGEDDTTDADPAYWTDARASFASLSYAFHGAIMDMVDRRVPLIQFARECKSFIHWDSFDAAWKIRIRPDTLGSADHTLTQESLFAGFVTLERRGDDELVDEVRVRFNRDWTRGRSPESYGAVLTSGSGARRRDDRYQFDFVRDAAMAQDLADHYAAWDALRGRIVPVALSWDNADVEKGDVVDLTLKIAGGSDYLQGINGTKFYVLATGYTPGQGQTPTQFPAVLLEGPI